MTCELLKGNLDDVSSYVSSVAARFGLGMNEYVSKVIADFKISSVDELLEVSSNLIITKRITYGIGMGKGRFLSKTELHGCGGLLSEPYINWFIKK